MAIGATTQWWVRTDGAEINGGGYDSAISGAGTNYCDQAAAQLALTDLATSGAGVTTLTSVTGGFTSAMIGNCVRIASGTNFQAGYYFITAYTNTNTVTVDRTPSSGGAGSSGVGKVGGALASVINLASSAFGLTAPVLTTPLAAGHIVNIRGSGSNDPGSSDWDYSAGYATFPNGDTTAGLITFIGYNGRPRFTIEGLLFYNSYYLSVENIVAVFNASPTHTTYGLIGPSGANGTTRAINCKIDANGADAVLLQANIAYKCQFVNSGSTTAGSQAALQQWYYGVAIGCYFENVRGDGIISNDGMGIIINNIINGCKRYGIYRNNSNGYIPQVIHNNIIRGCGSDGIRLTAVNDVTGIRIFNNIIINNGGYGINCVAGSALINNKSIGLLFNNAYYNNTSGERNKLSAGTGDVTLTGDPFTNAAAGDYTLNATSGAGAACKSVGFPGTIVTGAASTTTTTGYEDIGTFRHVDPSASSGGGLRIAGHGGLAS